MLGSCLITDPAQIEDPLNSPPAIRSAPNAESRNVAINQIINLTYDESGELVIPIIVRDENVFDRLVMQVWIDFRPGTGMNPASGTALYATMASGDEDEDEDDDELRSIPVTGEPDRDEIEIIIPHSLLGPAVVCHRVEVLVTQRFAPRLAAAHRVPEIDGDIGMAVFWISMRQAGSTEDPGMSTCP